MPRKAWTKKMNELFSDPLLTDDDIALIVKKPINVVAAQRKRISEKKNKKTTSNVKSQLCWDCKNACGNCSWSDKSFTPVEGWVAEQVPYGKNDTTYRIKECPLFVHD